MRFPNLPVLPAPWFLALALIALVVTRIMIVDITPANDDFIDLSIYCEVGELVVNGVDPYDIEAKRDLREQLRLNGHGAAPYVTASKGSYDFYVTSNWPASTLLYGAIEWLSGGSPHGWRLILISGDLAIALATFFFLRRVGIKLDNVETQAAFVLSAICYPSLIQWGTVLAEDKQFQIALMVALAGLLITPGRTPSLNAAAIGILGCLSVMFKVLGIFLAPVALCYFWSRPRRESLIAIGTALAIALPMILFFDGAFVVRMFNRFREQSSPLAMVSSLHASPWSLLPNSWGVYRILRARRAGDRRLCQRQDRHPELLRGAERRVRLSLALGRQHGQNEHRNDIRAHMQRDDFGAGVADSDPDQFPGSGADLLCRIPPQTVRARIGSRTAGRLRNGDICRVLFFPAAHQQIG